MTKAEMAMMTDYSGTEANVRGERNLKTVNDVMTEEIPMKNKQTLDGSYRHRSQRNLSAVPTGSS